MPPATTSELESTGNDEMHSSRDHEAESSTSTALDKEPENFSGSATPSSSTSSSPKWGNNKRRNSKNSEPIAQHSLSLNSLLQCPGTSSTLKLFSESRENVSDNSNPAVTTRVFEALAKFQTCLFLLTNTVVSLHESLKELIPFRSGVDSELPTRAESSTSPPTGTMVKVTPILEKLSRSRSNPVHDNNNHNKNGNEKGKQWEI